MAEKCRRISMRKWLCIYAPKILHISQSFVSRLRNSRMVQYILSLLAVLHLSLLSLDAITMTEISVDLLPAGWLLNGITNIACNCIIFPSWVYPVWRGSSNLSLPHCKGWGSGDTEGIRTFSSSQRGLFGLMQDPLYPNLRDRKVWGSAECQRKKFNKHQLKTQ